MPRHLLACFLFATLFTAAAHAAPAPWFSWESLLNGHRVCAQTTPGPGWRKAAGPFRNAACRPTQQVPAQ